MRIGGMTPLTTIDYPGELAAVVFCQGCPWRCAYCHNPHLQPSQSASGIGWTEVLGFLERRRGLLDAVVLSGGEPTLHKDLPQALAALRDLGFKTGVHTAGCYPERLADALAYLDWVGLDIKALPEDYPAIAGVPTTEDVAWRCLDLLLASGTAFEARTTWAPDIPADRIEEIAERLSERGVRHFALQRCRPPRGRQRGHDCAHPAELSSELALRLANRFEHFELR